MEQDNKQLPVEEQEIDLLELARKVWADRKLVKSTSSNWPVKCGQTASLY